MELDQVIEKYYRLAYGSSQSRRVRYSANLPPEMLVPGSRDRAGWVEWWLLHRSKSVDPGFADLENEAGRVLPQTFKLWHSRYYTLDADVGIVRLLPAPKNDPFGHLRDLIFKAKSSVKILEAGLIPFGQERLAQAGPLCFDTRQPREDGEWPIVFWDHDWVDTDKEISPIIFSSFTKLLECCVYYLMGEDARQARRSRISAFFAIDPEGAGGPGRSYWETWLPDNGW